MVVQVTGHMGRTVYQSHTTPISNYAITPKDAWLGAPDGNEAWSSSSAYAASARITGDQFGFNIPTGSTIISVKVGFSASRNNGTTVFEMLAADGTTVLESITGVTRNTTKASTRQYTAEELNALSIRWTSQNIADYAVIDGFTVIVEYVEPGIPAKSMSTVKYAKDYIRFNPSSDGAVTTPQYATGKPDGVQAKYVQTSGASSRTYFSINSLNIPEDAYIKSVKLRWTAQNESKSGWIELQTPENVLLASVYGSPNGQYEVTTALTPAQLNTAQFVFRNPVQYNVATYLDAIDIQVDYVDFTDMDQQQAVSWAQELVPAQTDFFNASGSSTYLSEGKYLGVADNVYATMPTSNVSAYKLGVKMQPIDIPEGSRIEKVHFALFSTAYGTLYISKGADFSTANIFSTAPISGSPTEFYLTVTPTREELVNGLWMRMNFGGTSNNKAVDASRVRVEYSTPKTPGPDIRYHNGVEWTAVSEVRAHNGTQWVTIDVQVLGQ